MSAKRKTLEQINADIARTAKLRDRYISLLTRTENRLKRQRAARKRAQDRQRSEDERIFKEASITSVRLAPED